MLGSVMSFQLFCFQCGSEIRQMPVLIPKTVNGWQCFGWVVNRCLTVRAVTVDV